MTRAVNQHGSSHGMPPARQHAGTRTAKPARMGGPGPSFKRVVFVIEQLRPGGGERVVSLLAVALAQRGVDASVICLGQRGQFGQELARRGIPVIALGSERGYDVQAAIRLAAALRRASPDVINVHDRSSLPYVMLAKLLGVRNPVVYTAHGLLFNTGREPRWRDRLAIRGVSAVTAVSEQVAARHAEHLAWHRPIVVIPNGVPDRQRSTSQRRAVRQELDTPESAFVFLAVGNIRPEKGFEDLMEATATLRQRGSPGGFAVWVAGGVNEPSYHEALLAQSRRLGLGGIVRFLGFREDVPALYSAADAFVLSSRSEGLPMVLLEAMTAGLPVVATRVGGVPDAVPEQAGLLVDARAPDRLSEAMGLLLRDKTLSQSLGEAARRHALANYSVDAMASRYLAAFEQVVSGRRREATR